jgi:biotin carboxyl carrier protein
VRRSRRERSLLVIEAMKIQNEIRAERYGVIQKVAVRAGETLEGAPGF